MQSNDKILIEARRNSVDLEQIAVDDLKQNLGNYLEPNWRAHHMVRGYENYVRSGGLNDQDIYLHMRAAFSETKGRSNKVFSDVLATHTRKSEFDFSRSLFQGYVTGAMGERPDTSIAMTNGEDGNDPSTELWETTVNGAARHLEKHGYWISKFRAPDDLVRRLRDTIIARMTQQHGKMIDAMLKSQDGAPGLLKGSSSWLTATEEMYELASDPLLLAIVQKHLGVPPIFNTPVSFVSSSVKPKTDRELSDNAQLYHHDMHRLGFVKVFIYLSDVTDESGPHTLVRGTHRSRPAALWNDGRHTDEAIEKNKMKHREVKIAGKAGTVFLVDTSALHKGLRPSAGHRVMAQVQYCNSLFGRPLANSDHKIEAVARTNNPDVQKAAELVRKYTATSGIRFMQNLI